MEYVDGELVERNVGEHKHSRLQALMVLDSAPANGREDYLRFGVAHIWIADPYKHTVQEADREGIRYCTDLAPETELVGRVDFNDLFARVDEPTD